MSQHTLVLNADAQPLSYLPLSAISWQEAIGYLCSDKVTVLNWYDDWSVSSQKWSTRVPAVVMLKQFQNTKKLVKFSRTAVYLRDEFCCLYCGCAITRKNATIDHVVPISRGGKTTWENCATACGPCNSRKGNRMGVRPKYKPYRPGYYELVRKRKQLPFEIKHQSWLQWLDLPQANIT